MPISVFMPALEMAQETGKLVSWLKNEGDFVRKGEPLLEIETDKAVMEIESPGDGILSGIKALPGAEVPVGQTIAWIVGPGETAPSSETQLETGRRAVALPTTATTSTATTPIGSTASKTFKISPKARRLAVERGIDLSTLRGSGPDGEILADDVMKRGNPDHASDPRSSFARLMAERTLQSWTTVPHFFVVREMDATRVRETYSRLSAEPNTPKLTYTDLLIFLVARVLVKHPRINATWTSEGLHENRDVNISLAIATEDAVVAPVIRSAHVATLAEIATQRQEVTMRARAGKLHPSDLTAGTFTISNLGMLGVDAFSAIISPPQVSILAVGTLAERVLAIDGQPAIRPMITMTLSSDHRAVDGARAAEFMRGLAETMKDPSHFVTK